MVNLYIPTSTLNINNILSTGSISPAAFYAARHFGYKHFEKVNPNPFCNIILLYDRYPEFFLEDSVTDNHPMVIRVRAERLKENHLIEQLSKTDDVTVYACYKTIYFDLASTIFLLTTQQVKQIALAKADPSLTTKLVELYKENIVVADPIELNSYRWSEATVEGIADEANGPISAFAHDDNQINRLKGFASGYILGAYKSIDPKYANYLSQIRTLSNEASAILNNPARKLPESMRKEVDHALHTLENLFTEADMGTKSFEPDEGDSFRFKDGKIVELEDRYLTDDFAKRSLFQFINNFCMSSNFYGQLEEKRFDIAWEGATVIRDILESEWEGSNYQKYINALLNNIKSGSEFNFKDSTSLALQSFAAFILKGDDLDRLEAFLISHGIGDLRIAFAIWGAMFGFSKLPKTVYNLSLSMGEKNHLREMHDYVHSAVHEIPLEKLSRPIEETKTMNKSTMLTHFNTAQDVLKSFIETYPAASPWQNKLSEMFHINGGFNKKFLASLNKIKVDQLGGKIRGVNKSEVYNYFKRAYESTQNSLKEEQIFPEESTPSSQPKTSCEDTGIWDAIEPFIPNEKRKAGREQLKWFQREWSDPDSKYYGPSSKKAKEHKWKPLSERTKTDYINALCNNMMRQNIIDETKKVELIKTLLK